MLERTGKETRAVDVKMAAGMADRLPRPELGDDVQSLVEELGARANVARFVEGGELAGMVGADAGTEDEATVREMVEADCLASELPRPAARERRDQGADAEAVGARRDGGQGDPGVDVGANDAVHQVVPEEEAVPTSPLGCDGQVAQDRRVPERAERRQEDAVSHGGSVNRLRSRAGRAHGASRARAP